MRPKGWPEAQSGQSCCDEAPTSSQPGPLCAQTLQEYQAQARRPIPQRSKQRLGGKPATDRGQSPLHDLALLGDRFLPAAARLQTGIPSGSWGAAHPAPLSGHAADGENPLSEATFPLRSPRWRLVSHLTGPLSWVLVSLLLAGLSCPACRGACIWPPHLSNWLYLSLQGHEARLCWPGHHVSQEKSPFSGQACRFSCLPFCFSSPSCLGVGNSLKGEEMGSGAPTNLLDSSRTFYPYSSEPGNYVDPAKEEHQHEENEPVSGV